MISGLRSCIAVSLLFLPWSLSAQVVKAYETTADLSETMHELPPIAFVSGSSRTPLTITVNDKERGQSMDGFGASITEGSAWLLQDNLSPAARLQVMTKLFDPVHGAGLNFLRQPIGSTDLSRDTYSFDDMLAGQSDPELQHFSAQRDDDDVFPILREALKLNPAITVMAVPWSAPAWMKTKSSMNGGSLRDDAMEAYSAYLVRSIQAFAKEGIPVKYLSVQNEPLYETGDYPGTLMLAAQAKRLIGDYLGPALRSAGLQTQILAYDHNWDHPEYPIEILSNPKAEPFVAGSALHCYGGDVSGQDVIHQRFPDKGIWLTECSGGTWQKESGLLATSHLLIDATRHWAKSLSLWGVALDTDHKPYVGGCKTCRGLVTIDLHQSPASVIYNGDFYALAHVSKFVHPRAVRIGSTTFDRTSLESVAFQNLDGSIALVVLNNLPKASDFTISWHDREAHVRLAPGSLATFTWKVAD
ncbi:glycoside hydrolase family 30 protein [Tunturiibacter lichenicola]|uniref:glycoside hydrolase family 30 protein n=1 Tax=Tunturiibacter lichenicola TaxID=2051959 RepID=UPI0021B325E9|nr:glycoside hydrolase family 30 beta sandwich domain-containing protein [Edaphobacter lichenicola]